MSYIILGWETMPCTGQISLEERLLSFTAHHAVATMSNMKAKSLLKERRVISDTSFMDLVIWQLSEPLVGSTHRFKYRLAFVSDEVCVLRYDNEAGKGNHKHLGGVEVPYPFNGLKQLVDDFLADVEQWRQQHEHSND